MAEERKVNPDPSSQEKSRVKIKAKDEDLRGAYSNLMQVLHTRDEFFLDFFLVSPPTGILTSRIIMSPSHIKRMVKALQENIAKYEGKFGKVETAELPERKIGFHIGD